MLFIKKIIYFSSFRILVLYSVCVKRKICSFHIMARKLDKRYNSSLTHTDAREYIPCVYREREEKTAEENEKSPKVSKAT